MYHSGTGLGSSALETYLHRRISPLSEFEIFFADDANDTPRILLGESRGRVANYLILRCRYLSTPAERRFRKRVIVLVQSPLLNLRDSSAHSKHSAENGLGISWRMRLSIGLSPIIVDLVHRAFLSRSLPSFGLSRQRRARPRFGIPWILPERNPPSFRGKSAAYLECVSFNYSTLLWVIREGEGQAGGSCKGTARFSQHVQVARFSFTFD